MSGFAACATKKDKVLRPSSCRQKNRFLRPAVHAKISTILIKDPFPTNLGTILRKITAKNLLTSPSKLTSQLK
jgi:hypothetical protein